MQDREKGEMSPITEAKFKQVMAEGQNAVRVGMVFKINHCYFEVESISGDGLKAKGIPRREYFNKRQK